MDSYSGSATEKEWVPLGHMTYVGPNSEHHVSVTFNREYSDTILMMKGGTYQVSQWKDNKTFVTEVWESPGKVRVRIEK